MADHRPRADGGAAQDLAVREAAFPYASAEHRKLLDLFNKLSPKRRKALIDLPGN
jgi:hypothetical protein